MPYYFMRDTPLQALEQLMMSQPGQKPRGGGIYRSPFHYTPKDVACEYCQNYDRKHPCRLCECTCLEERIEAGVPPGDLDPERGQAGGLAVSEPLGAWPEDLQTFPYGAAHRHSTAAGVHLPSQV